MSDKLKVWLVESMGVDRHLFRKKEDAIQFINESNTENLEYELSEIEVIE